MSAVVLDMSTFEEMARRAQAQLTDSERRVLAQRFAPPWTPGALVHVTLRIKLKPRIKRGRGQRKNRRDRSGRVKHAAHVLVDRLLAR